MSMYAGKRWSQILVAMVGLACMPAVHAQVGVVQGTVAGATPGAVLPVMKGEQKVADITVGADGKFSAALGTGVYTVKCPNGSTPKFAVLNGASNAAINCAK